MDFSVSKPFEPVVSSDAIMHSCAAEVTSDKSPALLVFGESLRELYWSGNQLIRILLQLENAAMNGQLKRKIHAYAEVCRSQIYSVEHIFELIDEIPRGSCCSVTESSCRDVLKAIGHTGKRVSIDKGIRSALAEFLAQELTALQFLMTLAMSMGRLDIASIINDMQRRTRIAFSVAFQTLSTNTGIAAQT